MSGDGVRADEVSLLWPGGALQRGWGGPRTSYLCLPSHGRARSLVPLTHRAATTRSVARRLSGPGAAATARRAAAVGLSGAGLARYLPGRVVHVQEGDDSLSLALLVAQLVGEPVSVSVHLGAPRANRKPVLEIMDRRGHVLGWGKLGTGPHTDRLVSAEADTLQRLSGSTPHLLRIPEPIARTTWQGHPLVLLSPLPTGRGTVPPDLSAAAAVEVAALVDIGDQGRARFHYATRLRERVAELPRGELVKSMAQRVTELLERVTDVPHGCWHGDWTPWNMSALGGRLSVWDWERFEWPVPQGFDELHRRFQTAVQEARRRAPSHAHRLISERSDGTASTPTERATASLYLLDLAARYLRDGQTETGDRFGRVADWVSPVLSAAVSPGPAGATASEREGIP